MSAVTRADGAFLITGVPPGPVTVSATLAGFIPQTATFNTGGTAQRVDAVMRVAAIEETVTVAAAAPVVPAERAVGEHRQPAAPGGRRPAESRSTFRAPEARTASRARSSSMTRRRCGSGTRGGSLEPTEIAEVNGLTRSHEDTKNARSKTTRRATALRSRALTTKEPMKTSHADPVACLHRLFRRQHAAGYAGRSSRAAFSPCVLRFFVPSVLICWPPHSPCYPMYAAPFYARGFGSLMSRILTFAAAASIVTGFAAAAHAQQPAQRSVFERYTEPIEIYKTGLGTFTRPISSTNTEAQAFFNQGFQMMYAFAKPDAVRSFREAWKRDPDCAICYWGEAWAWGSYLNGADDRRASRRSPTRRCRRRCR